MANGEEFFEAKKLIDDNVRGCNACYIHSEDFSPFAATINSSSKVLVITDDPPENMKGGEEYVNTRDYLDLVVYFGDSWLTRPVSPLSHTFACKCLKSLFINSVADPYTRCKMHTLDYIIGLNFNGVIAVGERAKVQIRTNFGILRETKNGRVLLALTHPNYSSMVDIQSNLNLIKSFQGLINN